MRGVKIQPLGIDLRQRFVRPFAGALHALLQCPDRFQILFHLALVLVTEAALEAAALVHQQVENTGLALEPGAHLFDAFAGVGIKQTVENLLRLVHRGNRPTGPTMGKRLAASVGSRAALGAEHHGSETRLVAVDIGGDLIDRNAVGLLSTHHVRACSEDIARAVPAQGPTASVIQPAVVAHIILEWLKWLGGLVEGQRTRVATRPPTPIVMCLVRAWNTGRTIGHVCAVGKIAHQHPFRYRLGRRCPTHAVEER